MQEIKTQTTIQKLAQSAAQELLAVQGRITASFAAGELVLAGTLESLLEAQELAHETASVQRRWDANGVKAIEDYMIDLTESLLEGNGGWSSSLVQNAREAAQTKALRTVYRALRRCL